MRRLFEELNDRGVLASLPDEVRRAVIDALGPKGFIVNIARGSVIDERKILNLPLNGRDYNQLALLSPGVLPGTRIVTVQGAELAGVNMQLLESV